MKIPKFKPLTTESQSHRERLKSYLPLNTLKTQKNTLTTNEHREKLKSYLPLRTPNSLKKYFNISPSVPSVISVAKYILFSLCLCVCVVYGSFAMDAEAAWQPKVGEKLTYTIRWMGIPVGSASLHIKEIVSINGRSTYHIVAQARSSGIISNLYRVRDEAHTYIDIDGFFALKFEKHQREGGYKADEVMEYDQLNHQAVYRSLLNNSTKQMPIPPNVQDALSCLYYFRTLPSLEVGKPVAISVNADEKNWDLEVDIIKKERIEMLKFGVWDTILVEPKPQFQGLFRKKGRMWISFSDDERRLPLLVKVDVPKIGLVVVALKNVNGVDPGR